MRMPFMKQVTWYLVFAMFAIAVVPRVEAGFAPSEIIGSSPLERAADLEKIQKVLEVKVIKERLVKLGYSEDEIYHRLSQLSDHQIHQFAQQLDDLRVGGDALGVVVVLLIIVILVIVVLYLTGHKVMVAK
ncbi:MAG: PA2779 family protein [Dissulfurispiraceae bacterium]